MVGFLSDNAAIATLLALTLLVLLLLAVVLWAALKSADAAARPSASQPPRQIQLDSLKQSFRRAVELIEAHLASRSERYNLAWTLVLNEDDDGHDLPLVAAGIPSALSTDTTLATTTQGISWNFFDKGVAVQLQSRALGAPDAQGAVDTRVWDEFLGLCRSYRAQRPFDSIVLAVPARLLLRSDPQGRAEVAARARQIHRRLWLAQNRFALRFPVVLVVSGCEDIPGFAALSAGLPEPLRRGMLGWSSSHELSAPFQPQWIHAAMDDVVRDLSDACAQLCALELPDASSDAYFMAPSEVERLRGGLLVFAEELMRPSAYHEPFIFRGVYLTGDCSALAQLAIAQVVSASADGAQAEGLAVVRDPASREPAFLRDVFEKKVFAEAGLVRASSSQRLRRPQVHRVVRWAAVAVPVAWAAALALAGWRLHGVTTELSGALAQFERGAASTGGAGKSQGPSITADRDRVLQALSLMERVDAGELGSRLIPGSWSMFDDLPQRVQQRLERDFSAQSIEPMARTLAARVSQLTGTALDPAAGALISASTCRLPMSWPQRAPDGPPTGLNLEDQPDYAALLQYLGQLDELDQARAALVRLRGGPGPASADDLRLAVRVLLGVTWSGGSQRVASLFRRQGPAPDEASANALAQAASCSFDLAMRAVHQSLFQANALLQSERRLSDQLAAVLAQAPSEGTAEAVANLQALLDLIRAQEALARPGQGAWISQRSVQFGPAHEALLQRVQGNGLLGAGVASAARQQAQEGFAAFVSSWDTTLADGAEVMGVGLSWKDKEGTWSLTGERLALRDGLAALLAQPWMKAEGRRRLPEVPAQAGVAWDRAKLDQAVALADARKRLHAELLPKFPAGIQPEMEAVAQAALADHLVDLLAQAMGFTARGAAAASLPDPERARLARIQALLAELGARRTADAVAAISARDALARLRLLDDAFNEADLFLPLERDFRSWSGDKGGLARAFGATDNVALASYVGQQQAFIDASAREAEALVAQVAGSAGSGVLVARWQAIVADVARWRLKSSTSSLAALEQFLLVTSPDLDLATCAERLPARPAGRRGVDPFAERLQQLHAGVAARCQALRQAEQQQAWQRFTEVFNGDLAGRAPFRAPGSPERGHASVEDIGAVLQAFERAHRNLAGRGSASAAVRRFDEQMQRVRQFLAPLFPPDEAAAGYDLAFEFRANPGGEVDGDQIIDWTMTVGNQSASLREPARALRWEPGMPIVLSLRIARDAPAAPRPDPALAHLAVDARVASFRFEDPWALASLIAAHREADGGSRADGRSSLLRFEFPLVAPAPSSAFTRARVYLRLTVSPPGKRNALAWPGAFPARAPDWQPSP